MWEIGERLREQREKAELDIGQVAEYESISKSYVSQLETGKNQPNWDLLARLATRYKTSADYILGLTSDSSPVKKENFPVYGREILDLMKDLSESRQLELVQIAQVLWDSEEEANKEKKELRALLDALQAVMGTKSVDDLISTAQSARSSAGSSDSDADTLTTIDSLPPGTLLTVIPLIEAIEDARRQLSKLEQNFSEKIEIESTVS